ncbi:OLC1v1029197C2 [Oldenlandia corymbosa var. corymbosa]|uniref:Phosphorylated adapter RNA export protein n=1 Tax=Oldenlandia corymbosa var. corymbosa TaxID=529605 RepID=A0AAV1CG82_OLDCO|nr:OLC1v1029197C2 [Oldenlandia corymbosa var. corymbosa]
MEGGGLDNVLDTVLEDENFEDVEMLDVEDGELFEQDPEVENEGGNPVTDLKALNVEGDANMVQKKNKKKKRKNKKKRGSSIPNASNISRFVPDVCRRLKEKKSYLVWAAVNCLGVPALSDLVKEVDAIQACGGQQTADGRRFRTGGGILWNILKVRDPNAYKEIMRRGKEFEKQFKPQSIMQEPIRNTVSSSLKSQYTAGPPDGLQEYSEVQKHLEGSNDEKKQVSVKERLRIPVAYDDLIGDELT